MVKIRVPLINRPATAHHGQPPTGGPLVMFSEKEPPGSAGGDGSPGEGKTTSLGAKPSYSE